MKPRSQNPLSLAARSLNLRDLCSITFCVLAAGQAMAQSTWTGATDSDWNEAGNWTGGIPTTSTVLNFGGATYGAPANLPTNSDISPLTTGAINFTSNGTAGQTAAFTLGTLGQSVTLGGTITTTIITGTAITDIINLNLILNDHRTVATGTSHSITINGIISQNNATARNLIKGGGGSSATLTLTGNNTYTGNTIIETGTLSVSKIADAGSGLDSNMGYGTKFLLGNHNGAATLNYTGSGNTTARTLDISSGTGTTINGGGIITQNGANGGTGLVFSATNFTNTVTTGPTERILTLGGSNTDANQISGRIANVDGDTKLRLAKSGAGRWILAGANTYTGTTSVTAGTLVVTGSLTSDVTVSNNGTVLSGTGTTTGTLTLNNNAMIVGGATGSSFKAETVTANATVKVAGSDGSGTIGSHTIGVVRYNSGTGPATANFSTAGYHSGASVANVGGAGGETQLTYTNAARTWNSASGTWDAMTTNSWQEGDFKFGHGDAVTFNDSGTGGGSARTVTLNSLVTPGSVTFNNTTSTPYTVSGTGDIGGLTGLTKSGNGTVTLSTGNSYSGATTVTGGTLVVNGSTGTGAVSVAAGTASGTPVATLGGTGTISGTLNLAGESSAGSKNGAVLAPGDAGVDIETLNAGTTTWNGGSIWNFDLSLSNNTSDQIAISGNLNKGSGSGYAFNFMGSQPVWNTTFTLATWTGTSNFTLGDFDLANSVSTLGSGPYSTSLFTLTPNSLTFTAVPEPTSALAGLLLSAGLLRRRRN